MHSALLALNAQLPASSQRRASTENGGGRVNYSGEPLASAIALEIK